MGSRWNLRVPCRWVPIHRHTHPLGILYRCEAHRWEAPKFVRDAT